jgi:DNA-binding LacI/PurR family transcriptional regulator
MDRSPKISEGRGNKHRELTAALRTLAETLAPGSRFPSQNELMRRYSVSDRTVLRSLDDLRREGVIVRRVGSGTFVSDARQHTTLKKTVTAGTSRTLAVIALGDNPFFRHCVEALNQPVAQTGLSLVCHYMSHGLADQKPPVEEALALEALHPYGFLLFSYALADVAVELCGRGYRVVIVGAPPVGIVPAVPCVYGDQEYGGYIATKRLLDLGHERIAYARYFSDEGVSLTTSRRWRGHICALKEANLLPNGETAARILPLFEWRKRNNIGGADALRVAYHELGEPTGIVCWTDDEAALLLRFLREAQISVPGDVSLVSYDNLPLGESLSPPLDTVDPHTEVLVSRALELLSQQGDSPQGVLASQISVTPTLQVRSSCAPPNSSSSIFSDNLISSSYKGVIPHVPS